MHFLNFKIVIIIFLQFLCLGNIYAKSAHEYAESTHKEIINIIKSEQQLFIDNPEKFTLIISDAFSPIVDFKRIARNVMGKYYKEASIVQRERFSSAFRSSLLNTYSKTLVEFQDEQIIVLPPKKVSRRPGRENVYIEILTSTKKYKGIYSMYLDDQSTWKIINIYIAGIDLGRTFRNQFYSLMEKNSSDIDLVIKKWETSL